MNADIVKKTILFYQPDRYTRKQDGNAADRYFEENLNCNFLVSEAWDDFVIKLTGQYNVLDTTFIELVKNNSDLYDAFVKFFNVFTKEYMFDDCVLGLFAIKCKYLKNFEYKCIKSAECEFADHVRQNVNKIMEIADLKLDCCFAEGLRMLIV